MECCCYYTNAKKMTRALPFVSTVVFSCVAANVCYYCECYRIICYVGKRHIRSVLLTATTLSNYWHPFVRMSNLHSCIFVLAGCFEFP